ncbi:MAG: PVC-type heme-binding CxxCH protein [Verrucomicrobiota bacterium]
MACFLFVSTVKAAQPFEIFDGDRVVLLGDTLIEREQEFGFLETRLYTRFSERKFIVRNLGWSADTPFGESRARFDFAQTGKGFEQIKEQIAALKPTVVFLGYGMASSFAGEEGIAKFKSDLNKLIDTIQGISESKNVRFILLSPIRHEKLPAPLPDPTEHNNQLALYSTAIAEIARERDFPFVSLFDWIPERKAPLTDNGIHLNAHGYSLLAEAIEKNLGWKPIRLNEKKTEPLRQTIVEKNKLFFNRWRPQNETYLFGFRKYEQGQNAKEIPMFDPLVAEQEEKIFELRSGKSSQAFSEKSLDKIFKRLDKLSASFEKTTSNQTLPNFEVAPGFEVNLFAENPQLAKPIQMNFDPQGRLWIASSSVYPQIEPGQKADDHILVVEDTNGDGIADKSTVFADGLLIPTGVAPGDGGVYVAQGTQLLHFRDTDGDGKADQKKIVLSGFGTEDTHHILHTLRWGNDGQLYFDQSIYIHSHIETPHGVVRLNSGGIFNLRPSKMELEVFLRGFCNPWGHDFDQFGQSFVTDGAGGQGINFGIRGATYFTYAEMRRELKGISPGSYPKFCGLEIVASKLFPDDWQGNLITSDFRAHRVVRFSIEEQGAGFVTKDMPDLLRTTNVTFRPIDAKFGPDGALYIADWSNPIIQHGEVDFRDPRRDHEHGRIWRVVAKDRPLVEKPKLVKAKNSDLLDELLSPNRFNREQARRVLTERGAKIEKDLAKWTERAASVSLADSANPNRQRDAGGTLLEGLWTYQAIDIVEPNLLEKCLKANDGRVRAAAVRVFSAWANRLPNVPRVLAQLANDVHPRVRLEAVRAAAKIPTANSAEIVLNVLNKPMDPFLDYAVWLSINDLAKPWVESIETGEWKPDGREKQLEFGLQAIEPKMASAIITRLLKTKPLARDGQGAWIELIGRAGGAKELQLLFEQVLKKGFDEPATVRALIALNDASRLRQMKPSAPLENVGQLFENPSEKIRIEAVRLAGTWKDLGNNFPKLIEMAGAANTPSALREAVFTSLREIGGQGVIDGLTPLAEKNRSIEVRRLAVQSLAALDMKKAGPLALSVLADLPKEEDALNLWRALLNNKGAAETLTHALPATGLSATVAKSGLRAARESGRSEPELVLALTRAANLDDAEKMLTTEEMQKLAASVSSAGDPARGEKIFRRTELGCVSCHSIGGAGGKVGPDMTSIGASAPIDYLIESTLYPSKKIKEGFHAIMLETKDDQELSGILVRENNDEIILRDVANKEFSVAKNNVKNRRMGGSLMPSGLIDNLSSAEQIDLFRFLSELGKPGIYDAAKGNVARVWKLLPGSHEVEQFGEQKIMAEGISTNWVSAFSFVDGRLGREEMKTKLNVDKYIGLVGLFAGTQFQVAKPGQIHFKISEVPGVVAWIDGKPASVSGPFSAELSEGVHTIIFKLDHKKLPEFLRLESPDATFLVN